MTYSESIGNISEIYRIQKEKLEWLNKFFLENLLYKGFCPIKGWEVSFKDFLEILHQSYEEYSLLLNRVESILNSPKEWKISKTDIEVIKEQAIEITNFPESLRNEYLWTLSSWKEQFPEINYDEVHLKINEYRWLLIMVSEFSIEIKNLLKMRISEKDGYYNFNDEGNTEKWKIEEWIEVESKINENIIQISEYIKYDTENYCFIDIKTSKTHRNSDSRIKFMETLIREWYDWRFVDYLKFIQGMWIKKLSDEWRDDYDLPKGSKDTVRDTYKNIRKTLREQFSYKNKEDDFCWGADNGYKLPFLAKKYPN